MEEKIPHSSPAGNVEADAKSQRTVQSVARAAHLLKTLGRFSRPTSLSDLARRVQLSKPATYNLLKTLEIEGLVSKDEEARYQLSWGTYELGSAVVRSVELTKLSRFHLDRLAAQTKAAVLLGILDDDNVLYLDRGQTSSTFGMVANTGRRSSLHATASGKVLLANQNEDYKQGYISRGLKAYTSNTITDEKILLDELTKIARRGYSTCWEEREVGLSSLSVALRNHEGSVQAALTLAAPSSRLSPRHISEFLVPLQHEAEAISAKLGWTNRD